MILPSQLVVNFQKAPDRKVWLETLPGLLERVVAVWSLRLETPFKKSGACSWVSPVIRLDGTQAMLKLAMPHMEGEHEIQGLRYWSGRSMVRLTRGGRRFRGDALGAMLPGRLFVQNPSRRRM